MNIFRLIPWMVVLAIPSAKALVSGPSAVGEGMWGVELRAIQERGLVEPNEDRASYQPARIDLVRVSATRGFSAPGFGQDHFARVDLTSLTSGREEVAGRTFYEEDRGHVVTLSYGFNFLHEPTASAGLYFSVSPVTDFNHRKFSVPRVDVWAIGLKSGLEIIDQWFLENSAHLGSGIPGRQNSYLALTQIVGSRFRVFDENQLFLKFGPYAELDLQDRFDEAYDDAFSPAGRRDRIRSMKIGTILSADLMLGANHYLNLAYVQKLGGYDAVATNASTLSWGTRF